MQKYILVLSFITYFTSSNGHQTLRKPFDVVSLSIGSQKRYDFERYKVSFSMLFSSVELKMTSRNRKKFNIIIEDDYNASPMLWLSMFKSLLQQPVNLNEISRKISPFNDFKFYIELHENNKPHEIEIRTEVTRFDLMHLSLLFAGVFLFYSAKTLSRSALFHYSSGASIGVLMSWMILLLVLYKLLPYKRVMTTLLVSGTAVGFYFLEHVVNHAWYFLFEYPYHLAAFSMSFAILSIALIYYFGPPSSPRGLNLLQWFMQGLAMYMIYQSSYSKGFTITIILGLIFLRFVGVYRIFIQLIIRITPRKLYHWYMKPPVRRMLTMKEYDEQGIIETEKALNELKKYCASPACNSWKVVSRLKEPKRFATFLTDGDQFTSTELEEYEDFDESSEEFQRNLALQLMDTEFENETALLEGTVGNQVDWMSDDDAPNTSLLSII